MAKKPTYEELEQRVKELDEEAVKRKQAEEALQESEERFRLLYERAPLGYQSLDEHGYFLEVNQAWLDILGYTREEVIGKSFSDFLHPDWVYHFKQNFSRFKVVGEIPGVEFEMIKKDGSPIMVAFNGKIGRDEKGGFKQTHCILQDITSQKKSEAALRKSEEKYRHIFNNAQVGIFRTRISDGKVLECNERFAQTYGYKTPEECMDDFVVSEHYTDPGTREKIVASLMEKGEVSNLEARFSRKDGENVWVRFFARAYPEEGYLEGVGYDITEEKRVLEELQKSEAQKKAILDASIDIIRLVDKEMRVIWANKTTTTELKATPEQLAGRFCYEAVAGRDTPCRGCPTKKALKSGKLEHALMIQKELKGIKEKTYWDNYAVPIKNESGDIVNLIQVARNITDRKLAEEALRESEKKYRTVLESNPDPVVVYDMEGRVIYFNPAFARVFGWSLEEQEGKKIDNFVPEENWPETRMMINKVTELGESFSGLETRRYTKEGNVLDISISGACYRDQQGNIAASVINLRDITAQKWLEAQLEQANKMEAIATLAGGVAHEFNNALMGVMGNIELLKMDLPEDESRDKYFEAMKDSGHRMSRLTDQLLAYAQEGKYQPRELRLDDFVIQTLPILQHDISPTVRVETHFPKDISYIKADNAQMQMVLSAILTNSDEAIEDEGLIRITVENKDVDTNFTKQHPGLKPGDYVCLTIEDDGKGMDEETKTGIFEPFFTTKFQGRGMGMAAVYGIVRNHDGWIYVDSELGKGTVVQIYLPAIEIEVEKPKKAEVEIAMGEGTILVIEDEAVLLEMNREILERLGYRVLGASTGREGVEIARTFDGRIDLALLDIKLPDMSGNQVYPLIMEARPDLKVVVCSGYSIDGPARQILDAGAEEFIQKPFLIAALSEKLKKILDTG